MKLDELGAPNYSHLKDNEIVIATEVFMKKLGITSGSTNTMDLYNLLKVYLKNIDKRIEINKVLNNSL